MTPEQQKAIAMMAMRRRRMEADGIQNDGTVGPTFARGGTAMPEKTMFGNTDGGRSFGQGVANTVLFGFNDELAAGLATLRGKLPGGNGKSYNEILDIIRKQDKADAEAHPVANMAGMATGGLAGGVGLAKSGLSFGSNAINAGQGLLRVGGASALDGALMGAAQGFGNGEGGFSDRATSAGKGAVMGGVLGGAAPLAIAGGSAAVRRVVSPFASNPERQAMADVLRREGIDLTAGQRTGSEGLRHAESEIGGRTAMNLTDRQGEQFTAAALRRAGIDANRATPDVINDGFERIGSQFDGLAARNRLVPDQQFAADLTDTMRNYNRMVNESARAPIVMDTVADLAQANRNGFDGDVYQALRSRLDSSARQSAKDPHLQEALYGLRNSLDEGMERSIASSNPSDLGAWREARNQYRNMLVLEKAATGAGENSAMGIISPSQLRNATVTGHGRRNYARGRGDFAELSRAGEALMKPLPNSGTAGRLNARNIGAGVLSTIGGIGGTSTGGPMAGLLGAMAGAAIPGAAGRIMMTGPMQNYLSNQLMQGAMSPARRAVINAILTANAGSEAGRLAAP